MHHIKLDQIISMVAKHGPRAMMAKFDVEAAYRNIAVHLDRVRTLFQKQISRTIPGLYQDSD